MKTKPDYPNETLFEAAAIEKIRDLATSARVGLFGTLEGDFPLHVRPMAVQTVDAAGDFWFLSRRTSDKNRHITADPRVQLLFSNPSKSEYLTVNGTAVIHSDRARKEQYWSPLAKAWFEGVDDPELTVIQVRVVDGHYWDTDHGAAISFLKIAVKAATGKPLKEGFRAIFIPEPTRRARF